MRDYVTHEWFTILTVFGIFAIAVAKYLNTLRFGDFISIIGNSKYLKIYSKDQKFIDPFDGLLFLNLAFSGSIFLFFCYSTFVSPLTFELISFLKLLLAVATVVIIKTLLERLIASLFEIDSIIDAYLFQKITFLFTANDLRRSAAGQGTPLRSAAGDPQSQGGWPGPQGSALPD